MIKTIHIHRLVMPKVRACLLCVLAVSSSAFAWVKPGQDRDTNTQYLSCSFGYEREECEQHLVRLNTVLLRYPTEKLQNWSWIIVSSKEWQPLLHRLHLDNRSIAFSSVEQRIIVLEEALFLLHGPRAEKLARNFQVPTDQLVSMAVSHEMGHILCRDSNEEVAYRVAEELRNGKRAECGGNGKSLTRMEELLYERSRGLGAPARR